MGNFIERSMDALVGEPRGKRLLIVASLILLLPIPYVALGPRVAPFARDLQAHPEAYEAEEPVLPLTRVLHSGQGWADLGEPGGTVRVRADPRFGLVPDEQLNVRLRYAPAEAGSGGGFFEVVDVGRHRTRAEKWAVSLPVLLAVTALAAHRVRIDPKRRALHFRAPAPARACPERSRGAHA